MPTTGLLNAPTACSTLRLPVSIDALESRRLLSATLEATRTLVINGTPGNDILSVDLDLGPQKEERLRVTENGVVTGTFTKADVTDMLIFCGDGDDHVRIGSGGFKNSFASVDTPTQVDGGNGNDQIEGGAGNDSLSGGGGDDFITGYAGDDFVDGGDGNDTIVVHIGRDTVFGGAGDDQLNGQETGLGSTFDGGDGNDQITGTSRKDVIRGGAGNDLINGGRGADRVFGGDGDDRITVSLKSARLLGEAGSDVFLITGNRGRGAIRDFLAGGDSIQPNPSAGGGVSLPVEQPGILKSVGGDLTDLLS
jgi:Ca2+-binding RTX toxin-like protein